MTNQTTGYICINGSGNPQDLSGIFQPLNGGTALTYMTGFNVNGNDLNTIFLPASSGNFISF